MGDDDELEGGLGYPPEGEQEDSAESDETLTDDELGNEPDGPDDDDPDAPWNT
jgi:hypothetical protein